MEVWFIFYAHYRWVTQADFWKEHVLLSSSTDRTIALWDTRSGKKPINRFEYHRGAISDILVGSRSEAFVVSAGGDARIATWDLRKIDKAVGELSKPMVEMEHCTQYVGSTNLARGKGLHERTVISSSCDGLVKEWNILSGRLIEQEVSGHKDTISCLSTFDKHDDIFKAHNDREVGGGTITASWDGTVRLRRLVSGSKSK